MTSNSEGRFARRKVLLKKTDENQVSSCQQRCFVPAAVICFLQSLNTVDDSSVRIVHGKSVLKFKASKCLQNRCKMKDEAPECST